jgi:hypothetical protein
VRINVNVLYTSLILELMVVVLDISIQKTPKGQTMIQNDMFLKNNYCLVAWLVCGA